MYVRIARYHSDGDHRELARRAESGLLPLFEAQEGFQAYSIVSSGDELWSFSVWDSATAALAANVAAASWTAENMAGQLELIQTHTGELLLSTAPRVTA